MPCCLQAVRIRAAKVVSDLLFEDLAFMLALQSQRRDGSQRPPQTIRIISPKTLF